MIETPVKAPPPSGPPAAPPPDARTRVMDPPPDPGGRHEFACVHCGAPLHNDQAACLSCGAMVEHGEGRAGIRRAAVGSVTALLVLSGAMGAAVAGLPHGKKVGKPPVGKVLGQKPLPPATVEPDAGNDVSPLAGADAPSEPPALDTPKSPRAAQTPSPSGGSSSPGTSGASGSGGSPASDDDDDTKDEKPANEKPRKKPLTAFTRGVAPASADIWSGGTPTSGSDLYKLYDYEVGTSWATKKKAVGIVVGGTGAKTKAVGLVSSTAGYEVYLYSSDADSPPSNVEDWQQAYSISNAEKKQKLDVPGSAGQAKYYLVRITGLPSGGRLKLAELQLIQ